MVITGSERYAKKAYFFLFSDQRKRSSQTMNQLHSPWHGFSVERGDGEDDRLALLSTALLLIGSSNPAPKPKTGQKFVELRDRSVPRDEASDFLEEVKPVAEVTICEGPAFVVHANR